MTEETETLVFRGDGSVLLLPQGTVIELSEDEEDAEILPIDNELLENINHLASTKTIIFVEFDLEDAIENV
jgi:hypothetical protein